MSMSVEDAAAEVERSCERYDTMDKPALPVCIYSRQLWDVLLAKHGTAINSHRLIYMPPQGAPEKAKRGYAADAAPTTKRRKTKWHAESTRASSLF